MSFQSQVRLRRKRKRRFWSFSSSKARVIGQRKLYAVQIVKALEENLSFVILGWIYEIDLTSLEKEGIIFIHVRAA